MLGTKEYIDPKEFLGRYRYLNLKLWSRIEQAKEFKELSTSVRSFDYSKVKVQVSGHSSEAEFEQLLDKAREIEEVSTAEIDELIAAKNEIEKVINQVTDPKYHIVLELKYMVGINLYEIAEKIKTTYDWACKLHGKALLEVDKIINNHD